MHVRADRCLLYVKRRVMEKGFTLIELVVTIAVMAVLLTIALPSFQESLRSNKVATATNELLATLSLARSEAIRNTHGSGVCPSIDGVSCSGGGWGAADTGILVWEDNDPFNGAIDAGETVLRYRQPDPQLSVTRPAASAAVLRFDQRGRLHSSIAGQQSITLEPSNCTEGRPWVRDITVNVSGQVTVRRRDCE